MRAAAIVVVLLGVGVAAVVVRHQQRGAIAAHRDAAAPTLHARCRDDAALLASEDIGKAGARLLSRHRQTQTLATRSAVYDHQQTTVHQHTLARTRNGARERTCATAHIYSSRNMRCVCANMRCVCARTHAHTENARTRKLARSHTHTDIIRKSARHTQTQIHADKHKHKLKHTHTQTHAHGRTHHTPHSHTTLAHTQARAHTRTQMRARAHTETYTRERTATQHQTTTRKCIAASLSACGVTQNTHLRSRRVCCVSAACSTASA